MSVLNEQSADITCMVTRGCPSGAHSLRQKDCRHFHTQCMVTTNRSPQFYHGQTVPAATEQQVCRTLACRYRETPKPLVSSDPGKRPEHPQACHLDPVYHVYHIPHLGPSKDSRPQRPGPSTRTLPVSQPTNSLPIWYVGPFQYHDPLRSPVAVTNALTKAVTEILVRRGYVACH